MKPADLRVPFTREALEAFVRGYKNAPGTLGAVIEEVFDENERLRAFMHAIERRYGMLYDGAIDAAIAGEKEPT